jgi:hypothetical protein
LPLAPTLFAVSVLCAAALAARAGLLACAYHLWFCWFACWRDNQHKTMRLPPLGDDGGIVCGRWRCDGACTHKRRRHHSARLAFAASHGDAGMAALARHSCCAAACWPRGVSALAKRACSRKRQQALPLDGWRLLSAAAATSGISKQRLSAAWRTKSGKLAFCARRLRLPANILPGAFAAVPSAHAMCWRRFGQHRAGALQPRNVA